MMSVLAGQQRAMGAINNLQASFEGLKAEVRSHGLSLRRVTQRIDWNPVNMIRNASAQARRNQGLPVEQQVANANSNATLHPFKDPTVAMAGMDRRHWRKKRCQGLYKVGAKSMQVQVFA